MLTEIALAQQACLRIGRLRDTGLYVSISSVCGFVQSNADICVGMVMAVVPRNGRE